MFFVQEIDQVDRCGASAALGAADRRAHPRLKDAQ
jgi:hypothetical protein